MRPVGGWLADRIGGAQVLSWVFGGVAVFALLLAWPSMVPFTVGALACAALLGLGNGAVFKLVPEHFPDDTGTVTGLVGALGGLGGFFPPLLLGVFRDTLGVIWPGFVLLSLTALALRVRESARVPSGRCRVARRRCRRVARQSLDRVARRARGRALVTLRPRRRDRRRLAQPRSTSTRRSSATRSRRCSRRSASPIATRCGCSGRRRGCTGGAAGRRSSTPRLLGATCATLARRVVVEFAANRFIFRRGRLRGAGALADHVGLHARRRDHVPAGVGLDPLRDRARRPRHVSHVSSSAFRCSDFPVESLVGVRHLPRPGVGVVPRDRRRDARVPPAHDRPRRRGACSSSARTSCRCVLLFAISVTGLMLTVSYTWMKGYAYDFLAILHAVTVIVTLLWLPFGKFFHIFQRPAQLGVELLQGRGRARRAGALPALRTAVRVGDDGARPDRRRARARVLATSCDGRREHYQEICPRCRRALFGLAQGALWSER